MKKHEKRIRICGSLNQTLRVIGLLSFVSLMFSFTHLSAQTTISGQIQDVSGQSLPGVTIILKGTTTGTISDFDGNYELRNVPVDGTLLFSFVGMQAQEIKVDGKEVINVTMIEESIGLDEVVAIGYGSVKKSDLTGAVGIVEVDEMKKASASDIGDYFKGRVAGVQVTSDGEPGSEATVRIRGFSTFGNSQPLYVIDGIPVESGQRDINPNDIETMQVLKDASAASVYGSRAANGVIIITTKSGKKSQALKVSYKGYHGIDNVWQRMPMLGREDYQTTFNASRMNYNGEIFPGNDPESPLYINDVDTDWQDAAFKTGTRQNHSLNLSGGGTYNTYNVSFDYYNSNGTLEGLGPEYNRYTARVKNTFEKGIVNLSTSLYYAHTDENSLGSTIISSFSGAGRSPMIVDIISAMPTQKIVNEDGSWGTYELPIHGETYSLNIYAVNHDLELENIADRMIASGSTQLDFGKALEWDDMGLKFKVNVSYDRSVNKTFNWIPEFRYSSFFTNTVAKLDENAYFKTTGLIENTLNYTLNKGNHNLDVLIGQMYQNEKFHNITAHGEGFAMPYYKEIANASASRASTYESEHIISSYLGRVNYNFSDRYLFTATMRRDGSSRFSKDNRFGYFPSLAFGWRLNNENFFNVSDDLVSSLKLRASWGQLGNENIGDYLYMVGINRNAYYNFNDTKIQGGTQTDVVSTDIKWETKVMTNIGVDAILFNGKLDFSAEYYNARSNDLLVAVSIPSSVGSLNSSPIQNAGTLENSGFEFTATYHGNKNDFSYDITGNISTLNNKVIDLGNNGAPIYGSTASAVSAGSISIEGEEVGQHFGYVYDGIFQTEEEVAAAPVQSAATAPGDIRFKDISGPDGVPDGLITSDDRTTLGSAIPTITFGLNFSANYKNWDFSLFVNGAAGFLINDHIYRTTMHTSEGLNWHEDILDYWRPNNTNTTVPRVVDTDPNENDRDSDRPGWLQKGNYLKFNNFTVGYTLPNSWVGSVFSKARIYATAQNFYMLAKYKGYNPDFSGAVTSPGFNFGSYPTPRTFLFGVNLDF